ncbi:MAG TPA: hypothetical protein VGH27_17955 [Streptosporangiaceae bacterium]
MSGANTRVMAAVTIRDQAPAPPVLFISSLAAVGALLQAVGAETLTALQAARLDTAPPGQALR